MTTKIEVRSLSYRYPGAAQALRSVSFTAEPGECIGLIGPSGAGKSTLLHHLNGLLPDSGQPDGEVLIDGDPISPRNLARVRQNVGLLFQEPDDQLFCPTVFEDVAFGPRQFGVHGPELQRTVAHALATVGLTGFESRQTHRLSGGEKRRVCLAGVLACQPGALLLDEPTANLDPRRRRELRQTLATLPATRILASHDLELVLELCSRVVLIDCGIVIADGPAAALLADEPLMLAHGLERPASLRPLHA